MKLKESTLIGMFFISLFVMALSAPSVHANTIAVNASINAVCQFAVYPGHQVVYPLLSNISVKFMVQDLANCSIASMPGSMLVSYKNGTTALNLTSNFYNFTDTETQYYFPASFNGLVQGNYSASVKLVETSNYSNSTTMPLTLLNPPNVTVSNALVANVAYGAPLQLSLKLFNNGSLSSNVVTLYLKINGTKSFNYSYGLSAIAPNQSIPVVLALSNITNVPGPYNIYINAAFTQYGRRFVSNTVHANYTVPSPPSSSKIPSNRTKTPIARLPYLEITTVPVYSLIPYGTSAVSSLGLKNIITQSETVTLGINSTYSSLMSLSATSLALKPNQTELVQVYANGKTTKPGSYVVPISINATLANGTSSLQTEYVSFTVYNKTNSTASINYNVNLQNDTSSALGTVTVSSAANASLKNTTLLTIIPKAEVSSANDINAYGLPNRLEVVNNSYYIIWNISSIPASKQVIVYYSITNPQSQSLLSNIQNILYSPSSIPFLKLFKITSISLPTLFTNTSGVMNVSAIYTGILPSTLTLYLVGSSGVKTINASYSQSIIPNQQVFHSFKIASGPVPGTYLLYLYASAAGATYNYTLPLLVEKLVPTSTVLTTIPPSPVHIAPYYEYAVYAAIAVIVIAIATYAAYKYKNKPRYNPRVAKELTEIKKSERAKRR
jgi:hypothetical protein